jgi:hypothetical protein
LKQVHLSRKIYPIILFALPVLNKKKAAENDSLLTIGGKKY